MLNVEKAKEIQDIKIIRFESSIYYANINRFEQIIKKLSGVDPSAILEEINKIKKKFDKLEKKLNRLDAPSTSDGHQNLAFEMVIKI